VKLYQNRRLGPELPPHIFAVADAAYHCMLKERRNQCIVISGESGSGKTESTNFLLHHLTALSQKGSHGSGVEQTILSAGPVLEVIVSLLTYNSRYLHTRHIINIHLHLILLKSGVIKGIFNSFATIFI
jgi:type II secretory pathway predicted ATPase ExeA